MLTLPTLEMKLIHTNVDSSHLLCLGGATGAASFVVKFDHHSRLFEQPR